MCSAYRFRFSPMTCAKGLVLLSTVLIMFFAFVSLSGFVHFQPFAADHKRYAKNVDYGPVMEKLPIDEDYPERACHDCACRDHLNASEKLLYMQCLAKVQVAVGSESPQENNCRFLLTHSRKPVALISFPGSGNTWVRQLLEGASGICTGSVMCDMSLRFDGFIGENINTGSTLVVKTHKPTPTWLTRPFPIMKKIEPNAADAAFDSAIIIIRNPLDALVSEWNRRATNDFQTKTIYLHTHTKKAEERHFRNNPMWSDFVKMGILKWRNTIKNWVIEGKKVGKSVHVVYYEDIKRDPSGETRRMLNFVGVNTRRKIQRDYSKFHRQANNGSEVFDPYTPLQRHMVLDGIRSTVTEIAQNKMTAELNLTRYL